MTPFRAAVSCLALGLLLASLFVALLALGLLAVSAVVAYAARSMVAGACVGGSEVPRPGHDAATSWGGGAKALSPRVLVLPKRIGGH